MPDEDRNDELIASMFDEVKEVRVETMNGKPRISTEATAANFDKACQRFVAALKKFERWDAHEGKYTDKWAGVEWWHALNKMSEAERAVWRIFVGSHPDLTSNMQYEQFRELLLAGGPTKANA
jgi:hypothetical protein